MLGNDHWTLDLDHLGMKPAGDELARRVLTCRPPYAICVQGKWGSGKTSLMRYAMARLGGRPLATTLATAKEVTSELPGDLKARWDDLVSAAQPFRLGEIRPQLEKPPRDLGQRVQIVPVWFNPWQHQSADLPVVGLLHELREQFTMLARLGDEVNKLAQTAIESGLALLGNMIDSLVSMKGGPKLGFGDSIGRVREIGEAYERRNFEGRHDSQRLNLLFEEAVSRLLQPSKEGGAFLEGKADQPVTLRRLVIFIDDLDRCAEPQTVHLLEAIKLYLQTPYCVFVLGMDGTAARRAVCRQLQHSPEMAHDYLEKLFQVTLNVPHPSGDEGFVEKLVQAAELDAVTGLPASDLASRIVRLVEPNPRKMKSFVSSLAVEWSVGVGRRAPELFEPYLLLTYLRVVHPDVYRLLSHEPHQLAVLHQVVCEGRPDGDSSPVFYFLHRALRHALPTVEGVTEDGKEPRRADTDLVVDELIERLDHLRGDRAFVARWKAEFAQAADDQIVSRMRPLLRREGPP